MLIAGAAARRGRKGRWIDMARRRTRRRRNPDARGLRADMRAGGAVVVCCGACARQSATRKERRARATETLVRRFRIWGAVGGQRGGDRSGIPGRAATAAGGSGQRIGGLLDERGLFHWTNYHVVEGALTSSAACRWRVLPVRQSAHTAPTTGRALHRPGGRRSGGADGRVLGACIGDPVFAVGYHRVGDECCPHADNGRRQRAQPAET